MEMDRDSGCENKSKSISDYDNERRGNNQESKVKLRIGNNKRKSGERYNDRERRRYESRRREEEGGSRSELYLRKRGYNTVKQNEYSRGNVDWDVDYRGQGRNSAGHRSYPSFHDRGQRYNAYPTHRRRSPFPPYRRNEARYEERALDMGVGWDGRREAGRARLDFPDRGRKEREEREAGRFEENNGIKGWVIGQPVSKRIREGDQRGEEKREEERRGRKEEDGRKGRMVEKDRGRIWEEWRRKDEEMGRQYIRKRKGDEQCRPPTGRVSSTDRDQYRIINEERQRTKEERCLPRTSRRPSPRKPYIGWDAFSSGPLDSRQSPPYRHKRTPSRLSETGRKSLPSTWRRSSQHNNISLQHPGYVRDEGKSSNYSPRKKRELTPVNLDENVIKKTNDDKITNEKQAAVNTPDNVISKSEDNRKEGLKPKVELKTTTNEEKDENFDNPRPSIHNKSKSTNDIASKINNSELYDDILEELVEEDEMKVEENVAAKELFEKDTIAEDDFDQVDFEVDK